MSALSIINPIWSVLFLTAKGQSFDRVLGLKLGGEDYITKPCDPEELVLRIKNILKRSFIIILLNPFQIM